MVNVRDFKRFRFRLRDQGCGPVTSYLHLYIANKYCAIKWLMHGKRSLSYTAISRKVVGKRARDNPERYFGWF